MADRATTPSIWDRFGMISDLIEASEYCGGHPEVLLQDIQEHIDAIHERLAVSREEGEANDEIKVGFYDAKGVLIEQHTCELSADGTFRTPPPPEGTVALGILWPTS